MHFQGRISNKVLAYWYYGQWFWVHFYFDASLSIAVITLPLDVTIPREDATAPNSKWS